MVGKEIEKDRIITEIQADIFERAILRDDYLLHRDERPIIQLRAVSKDLDQIITQARSVFVSADEQGAIDLLASNKDFNDQAMSQIIAQPSPELQQQLISQILVKSQDNIAIASQLADTSRSKVMGNQQKTIFIVLLLIAGISLIIMAALYFIWRSIGQPLIGLKETAERIAALDFTTTTTTTTSGGGELGEVARVFNDMAGKLKDSYTSVKNANIANQNVLEDLSVEKSEMGKAKAKDEAILASIGDGIIATDPDRRIIVMNKVAEKLLGWKIDEAIGQLYDDIVLLEDEKGSFVPPEEKPLHKAFAKGTTTTAAILYLVSKNKIKFPVAITVAPIILDNNIIGAVEVFRDITKEHQVDKAKTEFVSLASHQLRTPLTTVSWYTEMILKGDVGKVVLKQKKYLEEIYHGNQRMIELVNTLLNVSRLELGTFKIEPKQTDIVALALDVLFEQKPKVEEKKLIVTENFAEDVPMFSTDPKLLRMVFQNLLANAVDYTPKGGAIDLAILWDKKQGEIGIHISDTGYGIPKNQQSQIFTKLFRADNVKDKDTDGTGLGLYIVKSIILNFGGTIRFESEENKGTTFYVTLPVNGMKKKESVT